VTPVALIGESPERDRSLSRHRSTATGGWLVCSGAGRQREVNDHLYTRPQDPDTERER
jgi:hypothetical protein